MHNLQLLNFNLPLAVYQAITPMGIICIKDFLPECCPPHSNALVMAAFNSATVRIRAWPAPTCSGTYDKWASFGSAVESKNLGQVQTNFPTILLLFSPKSGSALCMQATKNSQFINLDAAWCSEFREEVRVEKQEDTLRAINEALAFFFCSMQHASCTLAYPCQVQPFVPGCPPFSLISVVSSLAPVAYTENPLNMATLRKKNLSAGNSPSSSTPL